MPMPCAATPNAPIFGICIALEADAGQTFSGSSPTDYSANFNSAEDMINQLDFSALRSHFESNYMDSMSAKTGVDATIYFRGIRMEVEFTPGNNELRFEIPELGVEQRFTGAATRNAAVDMLEDFLEKDGGDILNRINKRLAEISPVDPLAGNPSSLMGTMVDSAFQEGAEPAAAAAVSGESQDNFFGTGLQLGRYAQGGRDVNVYTLPFRYTFDRPSGNTLTLRAPVTYMDAQGAASYKIGLGLAYGRAMNERWTLTPGVEYGLVASADLISAGQVGSFTLTSLYKLDGPRDFTVGIANMGGYYKTFPIKIGDVKIDPDIANQVAKNGIILEKKKDAGGRKLHFKAYLTDTRFFGDKLYADQYNEIGLFITRSQSGGAANRLGLNIKYLFSPQSDVDVNGVNFSLSYNF